MVFKNRNIESNSAMAGFSLLEVLVVVSICAALAWFVIPGWRGVIVEQRMQATSYQLQYLLLYARDLAVSRNRPVVVCGSTDHRRCDGNWQRSVVVLLQDQPGQTTLLRLWQQLPSGWGLQWKSSLAKNNELVFQPSGDTAGQQGSFYISDKSGRTLRRLVVSSGGRIHFAHSVSR